MIRRDNDGHAEDYALLALEGWAGAHESIGSEKMSNKCRAAALNRKRALESGSPEIHGEGRGVDEALRLMGGGA